MPVTDDRPTVEDHRWIYFAKNINSLRPGDALVSYVIIPLGNDLLLRIWCKAIAWVSIGWGNGLVLIRQQAITYTDDN